ncbi:MAG: RagB/SusD family nutrient uptake outer membrane protein, partial [Muribaculaceae bacterium]|nr:RagB/SusD family nutrient uptake outer membrane protein [Muribaculaceae bacterium]
MKAKIFLKSALALAVMGTLASCNDYLDKQPIAQVTPEGYFTQESHLEAYANGRYTSVLPSSGNWSYGIYGWDQNTDNMVSNQASNIYIKGEWRTAMAEGDYNFTNINTINYFFDVVMPKYEKGEIQGNDANIRHYIGEMYFMRAYVYYGLMIKYGDFPIIEQSLPDDLEVLSAASERHPMNEVARFILSDLDKAYDYMKDAKMDRTRLNADVARLIKSRVALYAGTWLKNFAETPFVPNGPGWPGKEKAYNANYQFPAGSLDAEANWFLEQAIAAAKEVGDAAELTPNTGVVPQTEGASIEALEAENRYLAMFGTLDL